MTLYHYVPNKETLLDGMVELVFGEIEPPRRPRLEDHTASARGSRPGRAQPPPVGGRADGVARRRPARTSLRLHDAVLGCLREAGFSVELAIQTF